MPIDINTQTRAGGVPVHIVTNNIAAVPNALTSILSGGTRGVLPGTRAKPATVDPFAGLVRLRKAIGKRLA